jgi:hypothetical protein
MLTFEGLSRKAASDFNENQTNAVTPEPSTIALAGLGAVVLWLWRRWGNLSPEQAAAINKHLEI